MDSYSFAERSEHSNRILALLQIFSFAMVWVGGMSNLFPRPLASSEVCMQHKSREYADVRSFLFSTVILDPRNILKLFLTIKIMGENVCPLHAYDKLATFGLGEMVIVMKAVLF